MYVITFYTSTNKKISKIESALKTFFKSKNIKLESYYDITEKKDEKPIYEIKIRRIQ
jgi:hypothetical protein